MIKELMTSVQLLIRLFQFLGDSSGTVSTSSHVYFDIYSSTSITSRFSFQVFEFMHILILLKDQTPTQDPVDAHHVEPTKSK